MSRELSASSVNRLWVRANADSLGGGVAASSLPHGDGSERSAAAESGSEVAAGQGAPKLRRDLGLGVAISVVVGNVIGSGIFYKPGKIAADAGSFDLILLLWVLGGGLCFLGGLCYAELAAMYPRAGGMYVYLREAYGTLVAFLFGWIEVVFSKPAAIGALAVVLVSSLSLHLAPWLGDRHAFWIGSWGQVAMSLLVIGFLAWVNILGVIWGGRVQLGVTLVKAGFLALVAVLPFVIWLWQPDALHGSNYRSGLQEPSVLSGANRVSAVLLAILWAYNGWHGVTPLAEEIRDPQRNLPFALLAGIGLLIVLYVGANVAYHGVLSMEQMKVAGDHAAEVMLTKLLGPLGGAAMSAVIICSAFGTINSNLLQAPRVGLAMGRDGVFFRSLGQIHPRYQTPAAAIGLLAGMAGLLVVLAAVGKQAVLGMLVDATRWPLVARIVTSLQQDSIFTLLTNFVIFSASIFYALTVLAVLLLRWQRPDLQRPYRTWGYPLTPLLFLTAYIWFLWQVYCHQPLDSRIGLLVIVAGIPCYFLFQRMGASRVSGG